MGEVLYLPFRKGKKWLVRYREPWSGRKRQISFPTEHEANNFLNIQEKMYTKEKSIVKATRKRRMSTTKKPSVEVRTVFDMYLETLSNLRTRSSTSYHLRQFSDIYGHRKASCITCEDINAFMTIQLQRGIVQSTTNRRITFVRTSFNWAVKQGLLQTNPLKGLRLPGTKSMVPDPPSIREVKLLYEHAAPHLKRVIAIGIMTGARVGPCELFRLKWQDIDLENWIMRMPNAYKGARSEAREIPIRKDLKPLLARWAEEDAKAGMDWLIHYKGEPVRNINSAWHGALKRAGITRRIRPYDLRHAFASRSLDSGADLKCVAELMGHANEKMILKFYQHTNFKARKKAINAAPIISLE